MKDSQSERQAVNGKINLRILMNVPHWWRLYKRFKLDFFSSHNLPSHSCIGLVSEFIHVKLKMCLFSALRYTALKGAKKTRKNRFQKSHTVKWARKWWRQLTMIQKRALQNEPQLMSRNEIFYCDFTMPNLSFLVTAGYRCRVLRTVEGRLRCGGWCDDDGKVLATN